MHTSSLLCSILTPSLLKKDMGYNRGHGVIMNNRFSIIASVQSQGGLTSNDQHEFNVVNDGQSALVTVYEPTHFDMSAYNITTGQGWLLNSWFQEVEIATGNLLFEWDALSHVPVDQTYVLPNSTDISGTGLGPIVPPDAPWDYFHINSIDKFPNGDYLISGRHVSAVYRISAQTGDIIWQLGAPLSNFSMDAGFNFTFQHDARVLTDNASTTVLSIFDNASNQFNFSSRYSSGIIVKLDHAKNHASLLRRFIAPNEYISDSQGNCQVLDKAHWETSNVFCGWGSEAWISEYTPDGKMVQAGHFAYSGSMSYRNFKFNYTTNPTDAPAAYVYAHNTSAQTVYYMSWSGATEVRSWKIYSGISKTGPWSAVDTVTKKGFETTFTVPKYHEWSLIEAIDGQGNGIRNTTRAARTFVPGPELAIVCDALSCPVAQGYSAGSGGGSGVGRNTGQDSSSGAASLTKRSLSAGGRGSGWAFLWKEAAEGAMAWVLILLYS
jgi:Arylsulfotransferase (ASST)